MFGAFKPSAPLSVGLLWKIPWRLSAPQKLRHRRRMRRVDNIVSVLDTALQRHAGSSALRPNPQSTSPDALTPASSSKPTTTPASTSRTKRPAPGSFPTSPATTVSNPSLSARALGTIKLVERWKAEMPTEREMLPKDKYTMFDRKAKGYRKGVHKLPKWTRVSQRVNPPGF
ncbi:hypothetical protein B0A48_15782 [Cryoendolithus antarcticus]|uniref:54S ribosomal protein L31, mitochondrial n=1 Tax=Cryoendolithus antarcticus TaxID=1507870 RepID=A0A1V8SI26_9PEZI|nr:hypothetical protein B0A48_15782 [Cryoendolithus antarcticus]